MHTQCTRLFHVTSIEYNVFRFHFDSSEKWQYIEHIFPIINYTCILRAAFID